MCLCFLQLFSPCNSNVGAVVIVPEVSETILSSSHSFYFILLFRSYFHHFIIQLTDSLFYFWYSAIDSFFSSVQSFSHIRFFATPWPQRTRPPCPSPTPRVYPNSRPLSQWCHPIISSSVVPFSSCPQSFQASGSFPMSQLFASGGQRIGVSASTSVLPENVQNWSPLGWPGWISLQSKGLSRVFSNNTLQRHQFFGAQLSL